MANIGGDRVLRGCDVCGIVDDHPRHSFAGTVPGESIGQAPSQEVVDKLLDTAPAEDRSRLLAELYNTSTVDRHLDCCREVGCPLPADDENNCANRTRGAESKRGKQLLAHLTKGQ